MTFFIFRIGLMSKTTLESIFACLVSMHAEDEFEKRKPYVLDIRQFDNFQVTEALCPGHKPFEFWKKSRQHHFYGHKASSTLAWGSLIVLVNPLNVSVTQRGWLAILPSQRVLWNINHFENAGWPPSQGSQGSQGKVREFVWCLKKVKNGLGISQKYAAKSGKKHDIG